MARKTDAKQPVKGRYGLLCPIARALDRVGDRWILLILRDLHAGPARFGDLHSGLNGLASNLLTDRLKKLQHDGLIRRRAAEFGAVVYELTELGERTGDILYELAAFGGRFPPDENYKQPGNLRTIAVTLKTSMKRVLEPETFIHVEMVVDEEPFHILVQNGDVEVRAGHSENPAAVVRTSYEPLVEVADGRLASGVFARDHWELIAGDEAHAMNLLELMGRAMSMMK